MRLSEDTQGSELPTATNSCDDLTKTTDKMETILSNDGIDNDPSMAPTIVNDSEDRDIEKAADPESAEDGDKEEEIAEQRKEAEHDPTLIVWEGSDDPENPMNWTKKKKWIVTILLGLMTFLIAFASSVFSTATTVVAIEYGVSDEVAILGTSLFVLGFAVGPLIWGPLSEVVGRCPPLFFGYAVFVIFQIPVAVAQNFYTILICRFLGGVFGCAPLAVVGGMLADFWNPVDRGVAVCVFASAVFIGPVMGPLVGGFVTQSHLGWRWTAYLTAIMAAFFGTIAFIFVPETSHGKILQNRARKLRFETRNWALHSKADETPLDLHHIVTVYLVRPLVMLVAEPILLLITIYMAFIYGILYLFFEAYPISFQLKRGWNEGVGALPFLALGLGVLMGAGFIAYITKTRFKRKMIQAGKVIPEERLPPMILGAFILPAGLFWFAWTSDPNISWVPQVLSGIPIGMGIIMIFLQSLNYLVDVYLWHANSALAANTLLRSFAGAGFPMFATYMFDDLGVDWATSVLAFVCVALAPVPILFYYYGSKLRKMSKHSPDFY